MTTSTRLRETIPTSLHTHLTKEAAEKGVRVSQLITQILMERYKYKTADINVDLMFED